MAKYKIRYAQSGYATEDVEADLIDMLSGFVFFSIKNEVVKIVRADDVHMVTKL